MMKRRADQKIIVALNVNELYEVKEDHMEFHDVKFQPKATGNVLQ